MALRGPRWIGLAILASFALNLLALWTPFLEMKKALAAKKLYTLPRSVSLMWDAELYAIAVLVVAFSILFPFAKLFVLWSVWLGKFQDANARRWLTLVERLGKWSMLDVFIVCLLLSLTDDQFLIGSKPRIGLPCFLAAILISMATGEVLATRMGLEDHAPRRAKWRVLLVFAAALHLFAVATPFVEVDALLLARNRVSVAGMTRSLVHLGWESWAAALSVAAFVVLAPLLGLVAAAANSARWSERLARWSMLDVFLFALGVFLLEGDAWVPTKIASGIYYLAAALAAFALLRRFTLLRRFARR